MSIELVAHLVRDKRGMNIWSPWRRHSHGRSHGGIMFWCGLGLYGWRSGSMGYRNKGSMSGYVMRKGLKGSSE